MISFGRRRREGREDAAAVKPPHAARRDRLPVEIARLELRRRFIAAVVKHDRRPHAVALVAIDRGHVRPGHAVVLELLVERPHTHRPHPLGNQIADRIIDHRRGDARLQPKAVGQVRRDVELAAADMDLAAASPCGTG